MKLHHLVVSHALLGALAGIPANAVAAIDADAGTVMLRTSCQSGGVELDNCFTTMSNLQSWIDGVRLPDVAAPLSVEIGPGTFSGFNCKSGYHVTLRGSGRQHSFIDRGRSAYAFTSHRAVCWMSRA